MEVFKQVSNRLKRNGRVWLLGMIIIPVSLSAQVIREWQSGPPLHTPRHGAAAVVLNNYIYVLGGATTNGTILNTVERYDPATDSWDDTSVAAFDDPRLDASAVVFDNKIYLAGGLSSNYDILDDVEVYDPASNSWSSVEDMRSERRGHVLTLINNLPCAFAGIRENNEYVEDMEYYDPPEDDWEETPEELPEAVVLPFSATVNNTLFIFGGIFNFPTDTALVGVPQPDWNFNWQPLPSLQIPRGNGAVAVLGDSIFLIGGVTGSGAGTDLVEKYVISSGQLLPAAPFPEPRIGMSAVTLNETIYVIGGYNSDPNQPLTAVEVYDSVITGIPEPGSTIPEEFAQISGYPNPFNGVITLRINVPVRGQTEAAIYNTLGQKINTLFKGNLAAGDYTLRWAARDQFGRPVGSGLYLAVLKGPGYLEKMKVVYVK